MLKEDSILWSLVNIQIEEGKKENWAIRNF